jgi:glycine C-acetyltransferase
MYDSYKSFIKKELDKIVQDGLFKKERIIQSAQNSTIRLSSGQEVINLCANNYLGLAQAKIINSSARYGLENWGFGLASVRFICGTQSIHKELEKSVSQFLQTEDTILYSSCFDANAGLFETLLSSADAIISDELNHASIIDGIRLCKAKRFRYKNRDSIDLETKLKEAEQAGARFKMITTDGVFSMDGTIAKLDEICDLAEKYEALVHFDDCHAAGFLGENGRGTHEYRNCMERVDLTTGTFGKALGGAAGGYTSGKKEIIKLLRQRSRPYLFSNTLPPSTVYGAQKALEIVSESTRLKEKLEQNTKFFRTEMSANGFDLKPGVHPITPIMFYDEKKAADFAARMLQKGVYVIAFSYPVVPKGMARIRTQISAAHTKDNLKTAIEAFVAVRAELE